MRTLKAALERIKADILGNAAIIPWMVRHAGIMVSKHETKKDGQTAY